MTHGPEEREEGHAGSHGQHWDLGGRWDLAPSVSEAWRFRRLHSERDQSVGAFARTAWISARVPGSVHLDLIEAGVLKDPNFALNSFEAEWVSARQWVYRRALEVDAPEGGRLTLCFDGVDFEADVYLDGQLLGGVAGTHTPARFDVSFLDRRAPHLLAVVLHEPPPEHGQLGRTSETRTLKPRYGYWWDFATRLVHVGLWRDVRLEWDEGAAITDVNPRVTLTDDFTHATVDVEVDVHGDPDVVVTAELRHPNGTTERVAGRDLRFEIPEPALWWPHDLGDQPLYEVTAFVSGARPVTKRFGVRRVRLVHNEASRERGARPYTLEVNGVSVYARGYNIVPTDLIPGRRGVPAKERALAELVRFSHANLLRFNGVGYAASNAWLDACDELGVMVWQEMPLSSSGTDNVPPPLKMFEAQVRRDVPPLVRHVRSHPCVVLFGAGNELTDEHRRPADESNETIALICTLISNTDGTRPFLPTSPSGPSYEMHPEARPEDLHDIHGGWHYRGVHDSYEMHARNRALVHSEFGCQAPSRSATLRKYLTHPWPMTDANPEVVHHGEWWLMAHRVEEVFGEVGDLDTYVHVGQAAQGDVLRHALTWNRSRQEECSAALVWQLGEPWPNAHNTSVVDYDLKPKLAYYRCKEANAPVAIHLGMTAPVGEESVTLRPRLLGAEGELTFEVFDLSGAKRQEGTVDGDLTVHLLDTPVLLRLRHEDRLAEQWLARDRPHPFAALVTAPGTTLEVTRQGDRLTVRNTGGTVAPYVMIEATGDGPERFSDNGFHLLPGEARAVESSPAASVRLRAFNASWVTSPWEAE
ncbi:beta-mannosidase [Deinococcus yavapaiensis]|uniref:beta-mannosidase n=1 Tax=Deinococcus yavapaiensis KR-236 TaxID=694435 RepID=A0A318SPC1_9DEIO|nr:glycoside hydrolase family 2 protein [Deinococcus yavapaiensis]PYE54600.1 beta-mannosidase [Deinococcus yavapaiensis KR-236]